MVFCLDFTGRFYYALGHLLLGLFTLHDDGSVQMLKACIVQCLLLLFASLFLWSEVFSIFRC